jgi:hypothetical protein
MNADELPVGTKRYVVDILPSSSSSEKFWSFAITWFGYVCIGLLLNLVWPTPRDTFFRLLVEGFVWTIFFLWIMRRTFGRGQLEIILGDDFVETRYNHGFAIFRRRRIQRGIVRGISEVSRAALVGPRRKGLVVRDRSVFGARMLGYVFIPERIPEYVEIKQKLAEWAPIKQGW